MAIARGPEGFSRFTVKAFIKISPWQEFDPKKYCLLYPNEDVIQTYGQPSVKQRTSESKSQPTFQEQFYSLADKILQWGIDHDCIDEKTHANFKYLKSNLFKHSYTRDQIPAFYESIKKNLELIWFKLHDEEIPLANRINAFQRLHPEFEMCSGGMPTHVENIHFELDHPASLERWLAEYRLELIKIFANQHIAKCSQVFQRTDDDRYLITYGSEIHVQNAYIRDATNIGFNPLSTLDSNNDHYIPAACYVDNALTHLYAYLRTEYTADRIIEFISTTLCNEIRKIKDIVGLVEVKDEPDVFSLANRESYNLFIKRAEILFAKIQFPKPVLHFIQLGAEGTHFKFQMNKVLDSIPEYLSCHHIFTSHILMAGSVLFQQDFSKEEWRALSRPRGDAFETVLIIADAINSKPESIPRLSGIIKKILHTPEFAFNFYFEINDKIGFMRQCRNLHITFHENVLAKLARQVCYDDITKNEYFDPVIGSDCHVYSRKTYENIHKENQSISPKDGNKLEAHPFPISFSYLNEYIKAKNPDSFILLKRLAIDPITGKIMTKPVIAVATYYNPKTLTDEPQVLICDKTTIQHLEDKDSQEKVVIHNWTEYQALGALIAFKYAELANNHIPSPLPLSKVFDLQKNDFKKSYQAKPAASSMLFKKKIQKRVPLSNQRVNCLNERP